ncbi:GPI-linked NAD(P)(+)--arginine ADP-ribosyltransferase 1-like [Paroedura picta]|uniref:GPI-linked NAD(P)(+)--arginine ADP-ribosyltransferase 1-like n=1 Tax=Paroedura picta TaxID=143630 RepID=UPI004057776F
MPPPCMVLLLYLMGFLSGELQVFSFSFQKSSPLTKERPFDMAPTSFDDQYNGCVGSMGEKAGVLQQAEMASPTYAKAWEGAARRWAEIEASVAVPEGFQAEYAIAALAYTQKETSLYREVNQAVREAGRSKGDYLRKFRFKAFHFFLTRALQVLQASSGSKCRETYRGTKGIRFLAKPAKKARFGYFASSSLNKAAAMNFGRDTFFTIRTCHGAYIKDFSFYPEEEEVLIPPFELFEVVDSVERPDGIHISLNSAGIFSNYSCTYVKDGSLSHLPTDVRMPFLVWGVLLAAGSLGGPSFL